MYLVPATKDDTTTSVKETMNPKTAHYQNTRQDDGYRHFQKSSNWFCTQAHGSTFQINFNTLQACEYHTDHIGRMITELCKHNSCKGTQNASSTNLNIEKNWINPKPK
jgi:hypothetical protein